MNTPSPQKQSDGFCPGCGRDNPYYHSLGKCSNCGQNKASQQIVIDGATGAMTVEPIDPKPPEPSAGKWSYEVGIAPDCRLAGFNYANIYKSGKFRVYPLRIRRLDMKYSPLKITGCLLLSPRRPVKCDDFGSIGKRICSQERRGGR
jgi:hypothetical protein